ncbi:MAG: hypothetical protein R2681_02690 [Pyrinomonadaceae bacterium]
MKIRQIRLSRFLFIFALFTLFSAQTIAQTGSGEWVFPSADKAFNACTNTEKVNFRAFAVNVAKQSAGALAVSVTAGTGTAIESLPPLTFSVQPLLIEKDESGKITLSEFGEKIQISKPGQTISKPGEKILLRPAIVVPVAERVEAVRIDVKGLFGTEAVSSITVRTQGETSGCVASGYSSPSVD